MDTIVEAQKIKGAVLEMMNSMQMFVNKYPKAELPEPTNDFILAKELLQKGEFNLAVCGMGKVL